MATKPAFSVPKLMTDCCEQRCKAHVISTSLAVIANAKFVSANEQEIRLELDDQVPFRPKTLCCVSFTLKNRAHVFMSKVAHFDHSAVPAVLNVELPKQVSVAELRSTFRIPVAENIELKCETKLIDRAPLSAKVHDISLNGIAIELEQVPELSIGDEVELMLQLNGFQVPVKAELRNIQETRLGMLLLGDKTDELKRLVRQLEMEFLRSRKNQGVER